MLEIRYNVEEPGNDNCPMHSWHYYRIDDEDRYRECQRCWLKEKRGTSGMWKIMYMWSDWRH